MGFLKNILISILGGNVDNQPKTSQAKPAQKTHYETIQRTDEECIQYFRDILNTEFPQYTITENVPVNQLAGDVSDEFTLYCEKKVYKAEWGKPYNFVLSQAGVAKGVVMLGRGNCHDHNVKYLISRMYAKKMGLPYINFYMQFANERQYVINRIKEFMKIR